MSEHDENVSAEADGAEEHTTETPTEEQGAESEAAPSESTSEDAVDAHQPVEEEQAATPVSEDASDDDDGGEDEDDLFLDPDEEGGEEVEDVPDVSEVQAALDEARGQADALQADLDAMTAERDDFKARLLRSAADLENFRKRKEREREDLRKYGAEKVVSDLLPAIDNLERALEHAEKSEEQSSIADGVKMVHRQLQTALEKHGIKGFSSVGERFDPQMHEAIQQVETTEFETGVVMQEFQKGYFIHDRLLRPSMTVVAKNVAPPTPEVVESPEPEEPPTEQGPEEGAGAEDTIIDMGEQPEDLEEGSEAGS